MTHWRTPREEDSFFYVRQPPDKGKWFLALAIVSFIVFLVLIGVLFRL